MPLPTPRPAFPWAAPEQDRPQPAARVARNTDTAPTPAAPGPVASAAPSDNRGFLEKFFGAFKPSGPALGYASPEDGLFGRAGLPGGPATPHDRYTAVYDISAHTVYMPDGTRLEAHSGLGGMMDDPRHVTARNTGPTPPHLYDLTLRESLFHGVQALRLSPVGGGGVYGRDGLLAHTYMLGAERPVQRLRVVPRLPGLPARLPERPGEAARGGGRRDVSGPPRRRRPAGRTYRAGGPPGR